MQVVRELLRKVVESCRAAGLHQASGLSELQRRGAGPQDPTGEMQTHFSMELQMKCQPVIQAGGISSMGGAEALRWSGIFCWQAGHPGGKFMGAIDIAVLGGLFRGPGEGVLDPQTWFLIWF